MGDEVLVVAESPIGFRRWMIEYQLEERFDTPHELGGVPSYALTRALFERAREKLIVGRRPVPPEQACYDVLWYRLEVRVDPEARSIESTVHTRARLLEGTEEVLYDLPEKAGDPVVVDRAFVRENLDAIAGDEDLRRYIL